MSERAASSASTARPSSRRRSPLRAGRSSQSPISTRRPPRRSPTLGTIAGEVIPVHVAAEEDGDAGKDFERRWREWTGNGVPLRIIESPYREVVSPLVDLIEEMAGDESDPVTVVVPGRDPGAPVAGAPPQPARVRPRRGAARQARRRPHRRPREACGLSRGWDGDEPPRRAAVGGLGPAVRRARRLRVLAGTASPPAGMDRSAGAARRGRAGDLARARARRGPRIGRASERPRPRDRRRRAGLAALRRHARPARRGGRGHSGRRDGRARRGRRGDRVMRRGDLGARSARRARRRADGLRLELVPPADRRGRSRARGRSPRSSRSTRSRSRASIRRTPSWCTRSGWRSSIATSSRRS